MHRFFYTIILSLLGDLIVSVVDGQTLGIDIIQIEAIEDDPLLNLLIETCILGRNIDGNRTCAGGERALEALLPLFVMRYSILPQTVNVFFS
jgi:hypothetical protein